MFRYSTSLFTIPLYHRKSLPLVKGSFWHVNFGAVSHRFYGKTCMIEAVTPKRSVAAIDRDMLNYVHRLRIRHRQQRRIYSEKSPTMMKNFEKKEVHMRNWLRKVQLAYRSYAQYATMRVLREQAQLVNKYGQSAVNAALGDFKTEKDKQKMLGMLHRAVRQPPVARPVKKHVVTRFQKHNDRYDIKWRQNGK
jgi:hypothetical protein